MKLKNKIERQKEKLKDLPNHSLASHWRGKLYAYQEAQKLFDETLKNIIDEIEKVAMPQGSRMYLKQIIQKQFDKDTSILDDFCEEYQEAQKLFDETLKNIIEYYGVMDVIDKLKQKHGAKR